MNGRNVDNAAAASLLDHGLGRRLRAQKRAGQIDRNHFLPEFKRIFGEWMFRLHACVIHENIEAPHGLDGLLHQRVHLIWIRNVGLGRHGLAAPASNVADDSVLARSGAPT